MTNTSIYVMLSMGDDMKKIWDGLVRYTSKEQSVLLVLYLSFTAFFKNTQQGTPVIGDERHSIESLKQLRNIFKGIPGYELKRAANDFEESIDWEMLRSQKSCYETLWELQARLEYQIRGTGDLDEMFDRLSDLAGDSLFLTPASVNQLIAALPVNENTVAAADLFCGLSGTGLALVKEYEKNGRYIKLTGMEQRKLYCDISLLRMFCRQIQQAEILQADVLKQTVEKTYDLVIADLPKGKNESVYWESAGNLLSSYEKVYSEWVAVQQVLNYVNETGKAMILVTKGALVRQRERGIREILTERDWIEGVITLPANLYTATQLGFELLVFNKCKPEAYKNKVFLADLSQEEHSGGGLSCETIERVQRDYRELKAEKSFSAVVALDEIRENDFSWNPFLYLQMRKNGSDKGVTIALEEIAEIHRGVQISRADEVFLAQEATHFWLNIRNIENDGIIFDENSMIRAKAPDWEQKFGIQDEDIVLTSKGTTMKICMVEADMPKAFLCGNLTRIRVKKDKYSSYLLYEFLKSEKGRVALECIQSGTTIKVINNTNLGRLPVPYCKGYKEKGDKLRHIYQEYRRAQKEISNRFDEQRNDVLSRLYEEE